MNSCFSGHDNTTIIVITVFLVGLIMFGTVVLIHRYHRLATKAADQDGGSWRMEFYTRASYNAIGISQAPCFTILALRMKSQEQVNSEPTNMNINAEPVSNYHSYFLAYTVCHTV